MTDEHGIENKWHISCSVEQFVLYKSFVEKSNYLTGNKMFAFIGHMQCYSFLKINVCMLSKCCKPDYTRMLSFSILRSIGTLYGLCGILSKRKDKLGQLVVWSAAIDITSTGQPYSTNASPPTSFRQHPLGHETFLCAR